jgi:indole-3-glycerol phosphate synthase
MEEIMEDIRPLEIRRRIPSPTIQVSYLEFQIAVPGGEANNILEKIVWQKEKEVEQMREKLPLADLQKQVAASPAPRNFLAALQSPNTSPGVIAEVKKASPSKGLLREDFDPVAIAQQYQTGGATCLSVLTDETFFQGSFDNLVNIRQAVDLPLLCKDFMIYPYQMFYARAKGADAVLLIAAILPDKDLEYFLKITQKLGMTALIEVHDLAELDRVLALKAPVQLVGINNRDLRDFTVALETTESLLAARGEALAARNILVVSESGLFTPGDLQRVAQAGASAVLVGESLIRQDDPGEGLRSLFV